LQLHTTPFVISTEGVTQVTARQRIGMATSDSQTVSIDTSARERTLPLERLASRAGTGRR
jgi:hypothetical protein